MTASFATVAGTTQCLDCMQNNIKSEDGVKAGLSVAIKCKLSNGESETKATAAVEEGGSFNVQIPSELKGECFPQLHDALDVPRPGENGLRPSKFVIKSKEEGRHTFVAASGKLSFSLATRASAFSWPLFERPAEWHRLHMHFLPWHKPWHRFPPYALPHKPYV
ncbi:unnamed protein product [Musa hybrid cultivar]